MKKILVPTDFSPNADKALNFAVQIAKHSRGEIMLVHSTEADLTPETEKLATERLALLKTTIYENEVVNVSFKLYLETAEKAIQQAISDFNIDLIIMGTLGNAGIKEKIYGSKTSAVVGKSPVPVLVIPLLSDWKVPSKILLAVNHFEEAATMVEPVFVLAKLFNASVQVAVFTDMDDDYVEDYEEHEIKIAAFRDRMKIKHPGIEIHAVHLAGKHFDENLKNWIDSNNIDMLVMLTHKRNLLESIFNRSMTRKMSYHTDIPMLAIPV